MTTFAGSKHRKGSVLLCNGPCCLCESFFLFIGVSGWSFLLVPAHLVSPRERANKWLCVCVCRFDSHKCTQCLVIIRRVFSDRLVDDKDMESFVAILTEKLGLLFDQTFHNICPGKQPPIFGKNSSAFFCSNEVRSWELSSSRPIFYIMLF